jgi:hypothetical protein
MRPCRTTDLRSRDDNCEVCPRTLSHHPMFCTQLYRHSGSQFAQEIPSSRYRVLRSSITASEERRKINIRRRGSHPRGTRTNLVPPFQSRILPRRKSGAGPGTTTVIFLTKECNMLVILKRQSLPGLLAAPGQEDHSEGRSQAKFRQIRLIRSLFILSHPLSVSTWTDLVCSMPHGPWISIRRPSPEYRSVSRNLSRSAQIH